MKKIIFGGGILILCGILFYQSSLISELRNQITKVELERNIPANRPSRFNGGQSGAAQAESITNQMVVQAQKEHSELIKLRGEVARLRANVKKNEEMMEGDLGTLQSWIGRSKKLKESFEQMPEYKIPEIQFCDENDWLDAAKDAKLDTNNGLRNAMARLRGSAKGKVSRLMLDALEKFSNASDNRTPSDLAELKNYFDQNIDDQILQRWELKPLTQEASGKFLIIKERKMVDDEYDGQPYEVRIDEESIKMWAEKK